MNEVFENKTITIVWDDYDEYGKTRRKSRFYSEGDAVFMRSGFLFIKDDEDGKTTAINLDDIHKVTAEEDE